MRNSLDHFESLLDGSERLNQGLRALTEHRFVKLMLVARSSRARRSARVSRRGYEQKGEGICDEDCTVRCEGGQ